MNFKKILKVNRDALVTSNKDFKAIFEIMFSHPDCTLCEEDKDGVILKHTYGEVYSLILSAASSLNEKIGCKGAYVALECDNSLEWIVAFWAILISGNKPYLVNTRYPADLTDSIIKTLNIEYCLCAQSSDLSVIAIDISSLKSDRECSLNNMADEIAFSSSATSMNEVVCFYSGNQVAEQILNFESIVKKCPRIIKHYKGQLKLLAFLPFYHVFGLFAVFFWYCFFGRTLVFLTDYSAESILKTCRDHKVTHIFAVPLLWHKVEQSLLAQIKEVGKEKSFAIMTRLSTTLQNLAPSLTIDIAKLLFKKVNRSLFGQSVNFCISGGSYLRSSAASIINSLGYSLHNGYGMSEIGITSVDLRSKPKHLNALSVGQPFDSVEYKVENGVLLVKGSSLCTKKIVNGKVLTVKGWFNTDDNFTESKGYYYIFGRQSDIVIGDNGENINPDRVEQQFNLEGAKAFSVLGLEGEKGEVLSLVVQVGDNVDLSKIKAQLTEQNQGLPRFSSVRNFYYTTDALSSEDFKISRKQIIQKIKSGQIKINPFDKL